MFARTAGTPARGFAARRMAATPCEQSVPDTERLLPRVDGALHLNRPAAPADQPTGDEIL
jgi:hypothetical protein